jgi:hypothetical protein
VLTKRFRLRTLMILVALTAIGLWVGIAVSRFWASVPMLRSDPNAVTLPAYMILVLALVAALTR